MLGGFWIAYLAVVSLLAIYAGHRLYLVVCYWSQERAGQGGAAPAGETPTVTVQLPVFNEMYVVERLLDAVAALRWPRDRLEIQVLDDSTDETREACRRKVSELRARGFDAVHLHRRRRDGFKAGALDAGLARARGELILVLDADFLPPPELLENTVGHFADPEVGMVQVRWEHLNRGFSPLTRVQALLLDGHFVVEQSVRCRKGRFFNFNGTAGLWRREAIEQAGGWEHDTLTEDLDLSYRALMRGWRFVYLLGVAAPAELPVDMNGFKSQQFRWAKGSAQVARKLLPKLLRARLPAPVKLEAIFHLTQNVPYLLTLLLVLLAGPALAVREQSGVSALELVLVAGTTGTLAAFCVTSQRALDRRLGSLLWRIPVLIAVTAGICVSQSRAVLEGFAGRPSEFVRTPKHGIVRRRQRWRHLRYRGARGLVPLAELALALYSAAAAAYAIAAGRWLAVPILFTFAAGLGYVGSRSLAGR